MFAEQHRTLNVHSSVQAVGESGLQLRLFRSFSLPKGSGSSQEINIHEFTSSIQQVGGTNKQNCSSR